MINLSAVILTRNEEFNLAKCIKSVNFCDEVLVIDDFSTDKTKVLAEKLGAKVFDRKLNADFSAQRNFGLSRARGRWVLFIDADEIVSNKLKEEILTEISKSTNYISGYYFRRVDRMWGKEVCHGEVGQVRLLRLALKNAGRWKRPVHEYWKIIGETKTLQNPILHYPHPNMKNFISEVSERSTIHAQANLAERKRSSIFKIIFIPIFKFIDGFIFKLGFLDGMPGFIIACIMSMHSFLAWSKLWMLQKGQKI